MNRCRMDRWMPWTSRMSPSPLWRPASRRTESASSTRSVSTGRTGSRRRMPSSRTCSCSAERPEGGPLPGGVFHRRRLAGSKPPSRVPTLVFEANVDRGHTLQKDLSRVQLPEERVDHGDREAGNQEVQTVSDVEAERTPHV